jgi:ABC-type bacteriocin/lantibiotic exporter with double-glycine peptidase domain
MFLRAHDRAVSASAFFRELDPGDQGLSLTDLRDASTRYGLPAEVRRCTYQELVQECRLPLIALLHPGVETGNRSAGHYVLVVGADSDGVTLVDGTSGEQDRYPRDSFCRIWQGYAVVRAVSQANWRPLLAVSAAAWAGVGLLILGARRRGHSRLTSRPWLVN